MKVEVKCHDYYKDRWQIFINDELWKEVHRTIFGKNLSFPAVDNLNDWLQLFNDFERKRVKGYVLWRLSSQSYHSEQLAKLLRDRLVSESMINQIIFEFKSKGFLDDENWINNYLAQKQKSCSLKKITSTLYSKGLSRDTIDMISEEFKDPVSELDSILKLLKNRSKSKDLSDYKEKQKFIASLMRKGFSFDLIKEGLDLFKNSRESGVSKEV